MKQRSLTPKVYLINDLKTTQSHSNLDQNTPQKNSSNPFICSKVIKPINKQQKTKPIPAKISKVIYRCGCVDQTIQPKTLKLTRNPLQNKRFQLQNKNKSSSLLKNKRSPVNKTQKSSSLSNILKHLTILCEDQLFKEDTQRNRKFSVIKYIPKQIIKSIDKIKRIERPIEKKVVKVKKIPRQIIKYKQVEVEVIQRKQELKFIDPVQLKPLTKHINIHKQVVKQITSKNSINQRMKGDLQILRMKRQQYHNQLSSSQNQIQILKSQIQTLSYSKSLDRLVVPHSNIPLVSLDNKHDMNTSIEATNVNSDRSYLIRSKSSPLGSSIVSYKSKLLINGKQQQSQTSSLQNILQSSNILPTESLILINSSPEIKITKH